MPGGRHLPSQWAGTSRWVPAAFFLFFCAFCDLRKAGEGDGDVVEAAGGERHIDEGLTGIVD